MADPVDEQSAFWIGRDPADGSRLPYVLRLPVAREGRVFLATRDTWPRGKDVFCHQLAEWPPEAEIVEQIPVEACWRAGAAIHLVLQRRQNRRSMFIWTRSRGRPVIFWRSAASIAAARPGIRTPLARGLDGPSEIAVDAKEPHPWRFPGKGATLIRRDLPVGDYATVQDGRIVAAIERKTIGDLATAAVSGALRLAVAELAQLPHAAIAIEGRWSDLAKVAAKAGMRADWLLNVVTSLEVEQPKVIWAFRETPALAQDWAYRWLAACAKAESERYQIPLLEERAIGDPTLFAGPTVGVQILDAHARRATIVRAVADGSAWTTRAVAERCGVSVATAATDLRSLVRAGALRMEGAGRARRYVRAAP